MLLTEGLRATLRDEERRFTLDAGGLAVGPGECVGLTGASGTGKTLLLELLGLLRRPDPGGAYRAGDVDLAALWTRRDGRAALADARGDLFGFVPQSGGLLPFLTAGQNIALSQRISGRPDPGHAEALIARLGLGPVRDMAPDLLSIGQRQRVAIARAIAHRPRVVIADEPTAALDPENAAEAMGLLFEAGREGGAAVILSSHDTDLLDRFPVTRYRLEARASAPGAIVSALTPDARRAA